jgi:hypothetical protein
MPSNTIMSVMSLSSSASMLSMNHMFQSSIGARGATQIASLGA